MRYIILFFFLGSFTLVTCAQQKKKHIKRNDNWEYVWKPDTDANLVRNLNELQYDSVKVFSFGCDPILKDQPKGYLYKQSDRGLIVGDGLVDSTQHWLPMLSDTGKILADVDINKVFKPIRFNEVLISRSSSKRIYINEPIACFEPHMGVVFYNKGLVNAHMDICLTCNRLNFEIFDNGHIKFRTHVAVLGDNSRTIFETIIVKYKLINCGK